MKTSLIAIAVLAGCGSKQPTPAADDTEPVASLDAAPTPVVVAPPDAEPPPPPEPPDVPAQVKTTDVAALRKQIKESSDDHQRLIWYGWIAEAQWAKSCDSAAFGLCVQIHVWLDHAPPTCDHRTSEALGKARSKKQTDEVWKTIGAMRQLWGDGSILTEVTDFETQVAAYVQNFHMAEEVAAAILILGDNEYEQLYAIEAPTGLDFTGKKSKASVKKFEAWFQALSDQAQKASLTYQLVIGDPEMAKWAPAGTVQAILRVGDVYRRVATAMNALRISKDVQKDPDLVTAFCDTIAEKAQPLLDKAAETYAMCTSVAHDLGVANETVDACATLAERLKPAPSP